MALGCRDTSVMIVAYCLKGTPPYIWFMRLEEEQEQEQEQEQVSSLESSS